jgi:hypothetical protein
MLEINKKKQMPYKQAGSYKPEALHWRGPWKQVQISSLYKVVQVSTSGAEAFFWRGPWQIHKSRHLQSGSSLHWRSRCQMVIRLLWWEGLP